MVNFSVSFQTDLNEIFLGYTRGSAHRMASKLKTNVTIAVTVYIGLDLCLELCPTQNGQFLSKFSTDLKRNFFWVY